MSVIGQLFGLGKSKTPKVAPMAPPPPPKIGDAAGFADAQTSRYRLKKRKGIQDSILASGLGDVAPMSAPASRVMSTLG